MVLCMYMAYIGINTHVRVMYNIVHNCKKHTKNIKTQKTMEKHRNRICTWLGYGLTAYDGIMVNIGIL